MMSENNNAVSTLSKSLLKAKTIVPDAQKHKITTLIAKTAKFRGDMYLEESIHINGLVEGSIVITGEGMILSLREGATVMGNVKADVVVLAGTVIGNIDAKLLKLHATAKIDGEIIYQRILVDDGATINSTNMSKIAGQTIDTQPTQQSI